MPMTLTMKPIIQITLLRHGRTTANALGICQGHQPHWPLDDVGIYQANATGKALCGYEFWRVYSSDLDRAHSTAKHAIQKCKILDHVDDNTVVRLDPRLREFALGAREGKPISLSWNEATALAMKRGEEIPKREFPDDVAKRTKEFLDDLIADAREHIQQKEEEQQHVDKLDPLRVLVTAHGGCLRVMLDTVMQCFLNEGDKVKNCSFTNIKVHYEDGNPIYSLGERVNDVSHLDEDAQGFPFKVTDHGLDKSFFADDAGVASV